MSARINEWRVHTMQSAGKLVTPTGAAAMMVVAPPHAERAWVTAKPA